MTTSADTNMWPHEYSAEQLHGLPSSTDIIQFTATDARSSREGMGVKVSHAGGVWVGNFQRGDAGLDKVAFTPSANHVCIIACGRGYWVPVRHPREFQIVPAYPVKQVVEVDAQALLLFADFSRIVAYNTSGLQWVSPIVSWDGLEIQKVDRHSISGLAWDAPADKEVGFVVDVSTGQLLSGPHPPPTLPVCAR